MKLIHDKCGPFEARIQQLERILDEVRAWKTDALKLCEDEYGVYVDHYETTTEYVEKLEAILRK